MLVGIIGAPNKGKSTIFSALTMVDAEVADYPFTTIKPNIGVAYVTKECVHKELGVICKPRSSICKDGTRMIPANIVDVAGLVPGAHLGKGMGNQFLNDLVSADALIQVVDISGETDVEGKPTVGSDPAQDYTMASTELIEWLAGIIHSHMQSMAKRQDGANALEEVLSGFKTTREQIEEAAGRSSLSLAYMGWSAESARSFSKELLKLNKPILIAANKLDRSTSARLEALKSKLPECTVVGCSGVIELALKKAVKAGVIEYIPGSDSFSIKKDATPDQQRALKYMQTYVKEHKGTGVQQILNDAYFKLLRSIVVYPVEDENKYTDHFGNVLPDALLMREGSTVLDLAERVHTDLAKNMLYAVDAKHKMRLSKDYKLKDNDVIRIVSAAR